MADKSYRFEWDENGVRVMVNLETGEKTPIDEVVERAVREGRLITPKQAMYNRYLEEQKKKQSENNE